MTLQNAFKYNKPFEIEKLNIKRRDKKSIRKLLKKENF